MEKTHPYLREAAPPYRGRSPRPNIVPIGLVILVTAFAWWTTRVIPALILTIIVWGLVEAYIEASRDGGL